MPRVAELREIDGDLWARIDIDRSQEQGEVSLWTGPEMESRLKAERELCASIADEHGVLEVGHTNIRAGYAAAARKIAALIRGYK